jgi:beta-glucanase (GH16 family)
MKFFVFIPILFITLHSCTFSKGDIKDKAGSSEAKSEQNLSINTSEYKDVSSGCEISKREEGGIDIALMEKEAWIAYELNIEKAGRYTFQIEANALDSNAVLWMEDYIGNPDDRTYNITGAISLNADQNKMHTYSIDGSPLNKGTHQMRLHLSGSKISLGKMGFKLLKAHQETPQILKQTMKGDSLKIVWSDEFDEGTTPDTSKWTFDVGNWGWGNNELQYYTVNRAENARIEQGNLIIEARKNDMSQKWTSARLTTRGKTAFIFGRIEFRAMVPPNKGNWAAGWTLGDSYVDEISWPYCGEIDILESVGYEMDDETGNGIAHASAHCGAYYFKLMNQPTGTINVSKMHQEFHTYAVDWSPEGIIAYVDDIEYFRYEDTSNELTWPFDKAQNIILNLAMGGGWGGLQGMDESVNTQKMIVDYVRVYEKI